IGLFLFGTGVSIVRRLVRHRGLRCSVHEGGIVRQQGEGLAVLRWDDVNALRYPSGDEDQGRPFHFALVGRAGEVREFPADRPGVEGLLERAELATLPRMLPTAREAVEAGATVGFGVLSISAEGLYHADDRLPWDALEKVERDDNTLTVWRAGRP